jgi:4-hydroxy-3-polyprenylbenzoate decarboxylase
MRPEGTRRIVLALTGASGTVYGLRLAEVLSGTPGVEMHVVVSHAAARVMELETDATSHDVRALAHAAHSQDELEAPPASGSWRHHGMIVCPCSMASLAAIARGLGSNLIHRAADVTLKEGRPLVLVPRETPLSAVHLENMLAARNAGAVILPPCPGFYHRPSCLAHAVDHVVGRILEQLDIAHGLYPAWGEPGS